MCGDGWELNLDEMLWVPGTDYIGGWREARNACDELQAALTAAWPDTEGVTVVAQSGPDGAGLVQLRIPAATAERLVALLRVAVPGRSDKREAS